MTVKTEGPSESRSGKWFGADRDKIEIVGDIVSPTDAEWQAEDDPDEVLNPTQSPPRKE